MKTAIRTGWCAVVVLLAGLQCAEASTLPSSPGISASLLYGGSTLGSALGSTLVQGSSAKAIAIQVSEAGTLSFNLTDKIFPMALGSLSFAVTDLNSALGTMTGPGMMSLTVNGPMTLYADVFATTQGAASIGLYNLQVSFAAAVTSVPLPDSGSLLGGLLGLLCLARWGGRPRAYNCNTSRGLMKA